MQFVCIVLILCMSSAVFAQAPTTRPQRVITWVNPKLPDGPGLTHHVLTSKTMGHDVGYVVWTPPGFDASGSKKYPVIYFLHGAGGTEAADSAGFSGHVAKAIEAGVIPPVIVVFPNGGMSGYRDPVDTMITQELIPLIDKNYPTIGTPKSRALAGFSMGGAGSVRLAIAHPEMFAAAGSMGGVRVESDTATLDAAANVWKERNVGFFFSNGDKDRPDAFTAFAEKLKSMQIDHERVILPETEHDLGRYYDLSCGPMLAMIAKHLAPGE